MLADISGALRAAWCHSLAEAISNNEDQLAQFTALEINQAFSVIVLLPLLDRPAQLVRLRTRTAIDQLTQPFDALEVLLTRGEPVEAMRQPSPELGIADQRARQLCPGQAIASRKAARL